MELKERKVRSLIKGINQAAYRKGIGGCVKLGKCGMGFFTKDFLINNLNSFNNMDTL